MVNDPEEYEYSGHRAYLGMDKSRLVDSEPVLRHFGANKKRAVEVYSRFVEASLGQKSQDEYYRAAEGRVLGSEEFLEQTRHRVGEHRAARQPFNRTTVEDLLRAGERSGGVLTAHASPFSKKGSPGAARVIPFIPGVEIDPINSEFDPQLAIFQAS